MLSFILVSSSLLLALTPEEIAQTALASTVLIVIDDNIGRRSFGSGFVIGDGQITTNAHIAEARD